jgi:hypothetical protein
MIDCTVCGTRCTYHGIGSGKAGHRSTPGHFLAHSGHWHHRIPPGGSIIHSRLRELSFTMQCRIFLCVCRGSCKEFIIPVCRWNPSLGHADECVCSEAPRISSLISVRQQDYSSSNYLRQLPSSIVFPSTLHRAHFLDYCSNFLKVFRDSRLSSTLQVPHVLPSESLLKRHRPFLVFAAEVSLSLIQGAAGVVVQQPAFHSFP